MKKKIAVILSGCGHKDGAEITESVSSLIAISEMGAEYQVFAPDMNITATDHLSGQVGDKRNPMHEAARIARGNVKNLKDLHSANYDALVIPGGFGAALHLCSWAQQGAKCSVHPEVERVIHGFYNEGKPIGAICIAPALIARVLGQHGVTVTIGNDKETAEEIKKTGAHHENCVVTDFITDRESKIVTTPAYMYGSAKPHEVFTGIKKAIAEVIEMA